MDQKPDSLTLFELNNQVKSGIKEILPGNYWVTGEVSELNINQSGHCYLELIEKKEDSEQIIARAKATIWAFTFRMLRPYFESVTGQRFSSGMKIMVQVSIEFHEVYGYSLNIKDIEPNFTIGDLSRKRLEIIQRLQDEGVFHLNKDLELPLVPQRIAVISSETAAGYGDFVDQLSGNKFGYKFSVQLFQAYMQGVEAEDSIISALEKVFAEIDQFDVVVIIRGGGSQADLNCFNSYWLCYHITQFPMPVITGIGHERDETIADMVAHTSLKTPTAVAEFIIDSVSEFDAYLDQMNSQVADIATSKLQDWQDEIEYLSHSITSLVKLRMSQENQTIQNLNVMTQKLLKGYLQKNYQRLENVQDQIRQMALHCVQNNRLHLASIQKEFVMLLKSNLKDVRMYLEKMESTVQLLDTVHILKRGYTLTYHKGKIVKSPSNLKPGDMLETRWSDGKAISSVGDVNELPNTKQ